MPETMPTVEERIAAVEESIQALRGAVEGLADGRGSTTDSLEKLRDEVARNRSSLSELAAAMERSERVVRKLGRLLDRWSTDEETTAKAIEGIRRDFRSVRESVGQVERGVQGVFRLLTVDAEQLPYPQRLTVQRFRVLSQQQEDGLIWAILKQAGSLSRRFVELGCGDNGGNSGFLASELGWTGLMVDGSADNVDLARRRFGPFGVAVVQRWLRREDIDEFLVQQGADGEVDVLSIDIDGNDYWLWEAIEACSPRLVVIEYNPAFGGERSVVVPYDPDFVVDKAACNGVHFGASLQAVTRLGKQKGYRLVATENVNAFLLREDVAPDVPALDAVRAYRAYPKLARAVDALDKDVFEALDEAGLPLVEIP